MDETGLFYRDTKSSYFKKGEDCAGGKQSKERITVGLCASMTGEKIPPLVIGKSPHPRCFKSLTLDKLPVRYCANTKAWMTTKLMEDWLKHLDRTMRKKRRHILLFLDSAPSHPHLQLTNVKIVFFPPNTTPFCQPMDQDIIQTMKLKYRKRQLQHVLVKMDQYSIKTGPQILKEINVLQAINWVNRARCESEPSTIVKCFKKAGFGQQTNSLLDTEPGSSTTVTSTCSENGLSELDEDDFPLSLVRISNELFGCEVQDFIDIDSAFRTCDTDMSQWDSNAKDILESDQCIDDDGEGESEQLNVENISQTCVSLNDVTDGLDMLKEFALQIGNGSLLESLMDVEEHLVDIRVAKTSKQTSITDFFQKT